jgi:pimeloyl-ACP methyl ester carboxylesterase
MAPTGTDIAVNGLTFNVLQEGDPKSPAVVLLHGFPDSAHLWRHQMPALARDYWVIAPDLRGFGRSSKPPKPADYELPLLMGDVLGILRALGVGRFHLVGHDFGAVLAWLLASALSVPISPRSLAAMPPPIATALVDARPELLSLTAMAVGHPRAYKHVGLDQREKSWYILFFQFERAEGALAAHDYQLLRAWSGASPSRFPQAYREVDRWIAHFRGGEPAHLRAALNWYRANTHPDRSVAERDDVPLIGVRTLGLWGEGDPHQTEAPMKTSGQFVDPKLGGYRYERLEGAGHWMQLDQCDAVNALLLEWLAK